MSDFTFMTVLFILSSSFSRSQALKGEIDDRESSLLRFYSEIEELHRSATTREEADALREQQKRIQNDFSEAKDMINARVQFLQK